MRYHYLILLLLLFFAHTRTVSQEHYNSWFRTTLMTPITPKIRIDFELNHRRQNGLDNNNLFDEKLLDAIRIWMHYKQDENVIFSISPVAYFSNYRIIENESDYEKKPINEYRFSAAIELKNNITANSYINNKATLEYRLFEGSVDDVIRLRYRLSYIYNFNSRFNVGVGDEIFINAHGTNATHLFDQNRLIFNFSYLHTKRFKTDFGYMKIIRLPQSDTVLQQIHVFYLNLAYIVKK